MNRYFVFMLLLLLVSGNLQAANNCRTTYDIESGEAILPCIETSVGFYSATLQLDSGRQFNLSSSSPLRQHDATGVATQIIKPSTEFPFLKNDLLLIAISGGCGDFDGLIDISHPDQQSGNSGRIEVTLIELHSFCGIFLGVGPTHTFHPEGLRVGNYDIFVNGQLETSVEISANE